MSIGYNFVLMDDSSKLFSIRVMINGKEYKELRSTTGHHWYHHNSLNQFIALPAGKYDIEIQYMTPGKIVNVNSSKDDKSVAFFSICY